MGTRSYKVTSPIKFKGSICSIGATVEMTEAEAAQFSGCIELTDPESNAGGAGASEESLNQIKHLTARIAEQDKQLAAQAKDLASRDKAIEGLKGQLAKLKEKPAKPVAV